jgi:hypothetical protein
VLLPLSTPSCCARKYSARRRKNNLNIHSYREKCVQQDTLTTAADVPNLLSLKSSREYPKFPNVFGLIEKNTINELFFSFVAIQPLSLCRYFENYCYFYNFFFQLFVLYKIMGAMHRLVDSDTPTDPRYIFRVHLIKIRWMEANYWIYKLLDI